MLNVDNKMDVEKYNKACAKTTIASTIGNIIAMGERLFFVHIQYLLVSIVEGTGDSMISPIAHWMTNIREFTTATATNKIALYCFDNCQLSRLM